MTTDAPSHIDLPRHEIRIGDLVLNLEKCLVRFAGINICSGLIDYKTIAFLMVNAGKPVTYRLLAEKGWHWVEYDEQSIPSLFAHVAHLLNKKLERAGAP